jgi:hypothetical protein
VRERLDRTAARLLAAFAEAGVAALLLKGPVFARVLYKPGEEREYNDVDILVEPAALERARELLRAMGCICVREGLGVEDVGGGLHAEAWGMEDVAVDLHWRLPATEAPAEVTWKVLYEPHQVIDLDGHRVATLSRAGLALHIATHTAQHGGKYGLGLADLELALERWPRDVWSQAEALAHEISATEAFAAGLQLAPAGRELARTLALPDATQLNWTPVDEWPRGTYHLKAFAMARSATDRARVVRSALLPPAKWILSEYPWAWQGRPLLIVAYAMHMMRAPLWGSRALRFHRQRARLSSQR